MGHVKRGCLRGDPWTKAELRTLKKVYPEGGVDAAAPALPGRTRSAIWAMARRLGMRGQREVSARWTPEEIATLKSLWGWEPVHHISRALDRLHKSVASKASELGLRMEVPEGYEYVRHAAKRAGYDASSMLMILAWARVRKKPFWGRTRVPYRKGGKYRRHIVESMEVDDAVAAWLKTETLNETRKRTGLTVGRIRRIAAEYKVPITRVPALGRKRLRETPASRWGCQKQRVDVESIDKAIEAWRATQEASAGKYESAGNAAIRHGVSLNTLRNWMARNGHKLSRTEPTSVETFDRVVAIEKNRASCQAVNPRGSWSGEEIAILQSTYGQGVDVACAALPGRTRRGIMAMAQQMGCRIGGPRARWSDEELAKLREVYPSGVEAAFAAFPDRTQESVRKKAIRLGLHQAVRVEDAGAPLAKAAVTGRAAEEAAA